MSPTPHHRMPFCSAPGDCEILRWDQLPSSCSYVYSRFTPNWAKSGMTVQSWKDLPLGKGT